MSFFEKAINWTKSSLANDKEELEVYEYFKNEINSIKRLRQEYIREEGKEDQRLLIELNGELISLHFLLTLKESMVHNKKLDAVEKARRINQIEELYRIRLQELENKIINMAITNPDNVYLSQISSSINIINTLIRRYSHLIAITKSGVKSINNDNDLKVLENNILIRINEIETRIATDSIKRH